MKDLIKNIRNSINMNQEQFADCLGTTVISINRWENGKTEPNKMAQKQLYQFCKDNSIDLAKMIIDSKTYENTDDKLILYHGSKKGIVGVLHLSVVVNVISVRAFIWEQVHYSRSL